MGLITMCLLDPDRQAMQPSPGWSAYRVGPLPVSVFALLLVTIAALMKAHAITGEISVMVATLAVGGFGCAWIGGVVPLLRRVGGPAIAAALLPSYCVYRNWLPTPIVNAVTTFTKESNFIYLYIAMVIVGSILGIERRLLLQGVAKILVPLLAGSALALAVSSAAGVALGLPLARVLPMVIVPVMAGGVGEGAIPLSVGYAEIFHHSSADLLAQLLPVVLFANFVAIVTAGVLNALGRRYPSLTGNGSLQAITQSSVEITAAPIADAPITTDHLITAGLFSIALYLLGLFSHRVWALPAPVTMLVLAVLLKLSNLLPARLEHAAAAVGRFFAAAVTYPLLFAVAVALTPWTSIRAALHPTNLLLITLIVVTLAGTGFIVGRWMHLFPIEAAIINACHTGSGGTGDVAILTAAERLELLPFAQIATRIGGAITVVLTLMILHWRRHG